MKRPPSPRSVLALALASLLAATGCKQESTTSALPGKAGGAAIQSAEPTSFADVTAKLDPGGSAYVYLNTEQWLAGLSSKLGAWRSLLAAIPDLQPEDRENLDKAFNVISKLIQQSGVEEVSGFGMSAIARETDFYHSKLVLHHTPGKSAGFLWTKPRGGSSANMRASARERWSGMISRTGTLGFDSMRTGGKPWSDTVL